MNPGHERHYILHEGERVYLDSGPEYIEYTCKGCGLEVSEGGIFWVLGRINCPAMPGIDLGPDMTRAAPFHGDCIAPWVTRALAESAATAAADAALLRR